MNELNTILSAQNEQFHLFQQCFLCNLYIELATFQLSSAASLNLGWSQNGVLGKGLRLWVSGDCPINQQFISCPSQVHVIMHQGLFNSAHTSMTEN